MGRELRIEDQVPRQGAVRAFPEVDEAEDLIGLLALAQVGVRVAERVAVGVLREEDEDARLAPAAHGDVVLLDDRMLSVVGHRVEVEVEGLPGEDRSPRTWSCQAASSRMVFGGSMRLEYSER